MLAPEVALSFFGAAVVLALTPGPDNLFVLTQSALQGRASGLLVVLGLCTGLIGHTFAVAAGLAAVFAASTVAFTVLKLCGALYLLWLAWQCFKLTPQPRTAGDPSSARRGPGALYRRGIIMNMTNPKVSLFFLAFLPQFTSPQQGSVALQTILLGALFMLATLLVFGGIALCAGLLGERLQRSPMIQTTMNRLAGLVFVALALKLATSGRA